MEVEYWTVQFCDARWPCRPGATEEDGMRELTADMFVSLDGFAAGADGGQSWTFGYFGPEFAAYPQRILAEPQIMIMGRVTYEIMARAWPSSPGPLARPMNRLPKLVFSATLAEPLAWNNAQLAKR